tara:strand:- start:8046 stop:8228 length:183 start_codon:yes stop_codon:yes gene_type:complete
VPKFDSTSEASASSFKVIGFLTMKIMRIEAANYTRTTFGELAPKKKCPSNQINYWGGATL